MLKNMRFVVASVGLLVGATLLGWCLPVSQSGGHLALGQPPVVEPEAIVGAERLSDAFRGAAKILRPSVVTITGSVEVAPRRQQRGLPDELRGLIPDEYFDDFSQRRRGFESEELEQPGGNRRRGQTGVGSGVIVSDDGFILTNNHVTANADELRVALSDGRTFNAKVVGTDDKSDVAVLKIDATGLTAARLGDSSRMQVGDWVIAVGSPFGLDQTVTAGIISATNRSMGILRNRNRDGYEDFLQTDAAINPGNSGGPLVNLRGEVIGINTAINSRTGGNVGIGFAIPSNMASRIMEDLRTTGHVVRGFIGVRIGDVTSALASDLGLPQGVLRGAHVAGVQEGGPAASASIQAGDVITMVDGRPVTSSSQFRNMVALTRPNTAMQFNGYRNGQSHQWDIAIGELTEEKLNEFAGRAEIPKLGLIAETLTPEFARRLDLEQDVSGAIVTTIDRRGLGWQRLQLRPEDIIVEANGKEVATASDFKRAVERSGRSLRLVVRRGDDVRTTSIESAVE